jgi:hypothetical protein
VKVLSVKVTLGDLTTQPDLSGKSSVASTKTRPALRSEVGRRTKDWRDPGSWVTSRSTPGPATRSFPARWPGTSSR